MGLIRTKLLLRDPTFRRIDIAQYGVWLLESGHAAKTALSPGIGYLLHLPTPPPPSWTISIRLFLHFSLQIIPNTCVIIKRALTRKRADWNTAKTYSLAFYLYTSLLFQPIGVWEANKLGTSKLPGTHWAVWLSSSTAGMRCTSLSVFVH